MTATPQDDWSPADHPYAIAVSEAQWWLHMVELSRLRIRRGEERWTQPFSSEQIDARVVILALRQLLAAEQLEQLSLKALDIDPTVGHTLKAARDRFEDALPGIKHMRDALTHFEDWSRGEGRGEPQRSRRGAGEELRDIARTFSGFGYDSRAGTITLGPYKIGVETASRAAHMLCEAIYAAAREVDKKTAADLRAKAVRILIDAGVQHAMADRLLPLYYGFDLRLQLSTDIEALDGRAELARQVTTALASARIRLMSSSHPQAQDIAERLARGESLYVRPSGPPTPHSHIS